MKTALLFLFVLTQSVIWSSDTSRFDRPRSYDAQHYVVSVKFDMKKSRVFGDSTITLTPLADGLKTVELDAVNLKFESVTNPADGSPFKFSYNKKKLLVTLNKPANAGDEVKIRTVYSATPQKGIYFVKGSKGEDFVDHSAQVWTQGESEETRHWLPSFDFPSDKATTETIITVDKNYSVISNGELIEDTVEGNQRTVHHKMSVRHPLYLLSFVVGEYEYVADDYNGVPLRYYLYPGVKDRADKIFGRTKKMMSVFEELTGMKYPYNKYDQVMVANFSFGGMENITATTYADTELLLGSRDTIDDLVAHELAHSWFGNLVTCRNWAELWTNESFASYMEAAYREKSEGQNSYIDKIESDAAQYFGYSAVSRNSKHGLMNLTADPTTELTMFDPVTYNKGSAVLHTLRREIGDEAFWSGVRLYLKDNKLGSVGTDDVQKAFETSSKRDLTWFFDQWVKGIGHPVLTIDQTFDKESGSLKLSVTQTASDGSKSLFRLPLKFKVKTSQGEFVDTLTLNSRTGSLSVATKIPPELVVPDPDSSIPLAQISLKPLIRE